jgi:Type I restriction enzyme R protein N terminus (HSDR_N)
MVYLAVKKVIKTLADVHEQFGLSRSSRDEFFTEWQTHRSDISEAERFQLDQVRQRFRYQREMGQVAEGTVNAIVVSRILELAGFYDPPFRMNSEQTIEISTRSEDLTLRGRIDFLVMQDQFWQAIIESKDTEFDIEVGIPQILAYMMGAPKSQKVLFGMVTNGSNFIFIKLQRETVMEYDFSDSFSLLSRQNCLYPVLQTLKGIGQQTLN